MKKHLQKCVGILDNYMEKYLYYCKRPQLLAFQHLPQRSARFKNILRDGYE